MKTCILLFCIFALGLKSNSDIGKDELSSEEYAVYSAYFNGIEKSPKDGRLVKLVVINNQTKGVGDYCSQDSIAKHDKRITNDQIKSLFEDLQTKKDDSKLFKRLFDIKHDYVLIDNKDFEVFFRNKDYEGWDDFYKKYPNSSGYIGLSRVGFNTNLTKAIIFRTINCGALCGSGDYILFEKIDGKWKEVDRFNCWMS